MADDHDEAEVVSTADELTAPPAPPAEAVPVAAAAPEPEVCHPVVPSAGMVCAHCGWEFGKSTEPHVVGY